MKIYIGTREKRFCKTSFHLRIDGAHTKLKTRMESNTLARQSFGMLKICKDCILIELCPWEKKERKKKDHEQN